MYSSKVLNEFYNPTNIGVIKGANAVGKVKGKVCGDIVKFYAVVKNKTIEDIKYQAYGNIITIAASNVAVKLMIDKTFDEVVMINAEQIKSELGGVIPKEKVYALTLVEEAIYSLIANYYKKIQGFVPDEYKFSPIKNSDELTAEDEKPVKDKAKKAQKPVKKTQKVIEDSDLDDSLLDGDSVDDNFEDDEDDFDAEGIALVSEGDKASDSEDSTSKTAGKAVTTKKTTKTIEVYDADDDEVTELGLGQIDDITSSLSDALKKLKEGD